jgi:hypothetical protein
MQKLLLLVLCAIFFFSTAQAATVCFYEYCENSGTGIHFLVPEHIGQNLYQYAFKFINQTLTVLRILSNGWIDINGFVTIGTNTDLNAGLTNGDLNALGTITANTFNQRTGGLANKAICWKTNTTLGYCSSTIAADGSCTCN